jgi:hypothetical protein
VKLSRLLSAPVRRSVLGLILIAVVLFPGGMAAFHSKVCRQSDCPADGEVVWSRALAGSWLAENGPGGTVYSAGQAYVAVGSDVAAIGFGLTLDAFDAATGLPRWAVTLNGVPAGSSIISVRVWPGVVTAGVEVAANSGNAVSGIAGFAGAGAGAGAGAAASGASAVGREEVVLDAVTGKQIAGYPAAWLGGAVSASRKRTVVVGPNAVTSYDNVTGKAIWRDPTGSAGQAWRVSGGDLYVTVSAAGEAGTAPVTALRQVNLKTGAERLIQPVGQSFDGRLSGVLDGVLLFSGSSGLSIYSERTGRLIGFHAGAVPEVEDPVQNVLYVDVNGALIGIDPVTGQDERGTSYPGPPGTYGVRDGVALGLDSGPDGAAWGYNIARKRVIWTTRLLPWPHFFVDLSGIGGSIDPASSLVLLVTCAKVGTVVSAGAACLRPALVAIER